MRLISLCAGSDDAFALSLCGALEKFGGALLIQKDSVIQKYLYEPDFIIYHSENRPKLNVSNALIIERSDNDGLIFSAFSDSEIESTFKVGLNSTNDITVSSIAESNVCISVLSPIKTFSGKEQLPCEIKIKDSGNNDIYVLLAAITVLLLTDKIENKYFIEV